MAQGWKIMHQQTCFDHILHWISRKSTWRCVKKHNCQTAGPSASAGRLAMRAAQHGSRTYSQVKALKELSPSGRGAEGFPPAGSKSRMWTGAAAEPYCTRCQAVAMPAKPPPMTAYRFVPGAMHAYDPRGLKHSFVTNPRTSDCFGNNVNLRSCRIPLCRLLLPVPLPRLTSPRELKQCWAERVRDAKQRSSHPVCVRELEKRKDTWRWCTVVECR